MLARLDRALAPDPMRHHNQPPELLEDPVEHAVLEGLRADLRRFRDALATAITDPAKRVESVVHDGSRLVGALKAVADHPIVQRPALGAAAVGISALALSAGVPVDPMITLGPMVAGPEGAKAVRGALGRLGGGGR